MTGTFAPPQAVCKRVTSKIIRTGSLSALVTGPTGHSRAHAPDPTSCPRCACCISSSYSFIPAHVCILI